MESVNASSRSGPHDVLMVVDPGICGFTCSIRAGKEGKHVTFDIQSECGQIQKLAEALGTMTLKDLFVPPSQCPIFRAAEASRCHLACPVPASLIKAAEVALGLALPKEATIRFFQTECVRE